MTDHLPILLLLLPLFGSLICVLLGRNNAAHSWVVAMISLGGSALLSLLMLIKVLGLKSGDFDTEWVDGQKAQVMRLVLN